MFPSSFFHLFQPFPRDNKIFVAMSFDSLFDKRWNEVIEPAIKRVKIGETSLEPLRVDARKVSDSIITEILTAISRSVLILADITTIAKHNGKFYRNANVMYEVGLAHAVRLPEEILLFRSDEDPLLFDMANIRVNFYEPDDKPQEASDMIGDAIGNAIRERDLKLNLAIKSVAESLDYDSWKVLMMDANGDGFSPKPTKTVFDALSNTRQQFAISKLLEIGALATKYVAICSNGSLPIPANSQAEEAVKYYLTPFGKTLQQYIGKTMCIQNFNKKQFIE